MWHQYRAHGLVVSSEVELALPPTGSPGGRPDLTLRLGTDAPVPNEPAPGCRLADLDRDGTPVYSFGRTGDRIVLRYPGLCELVGDRTLSQVTARLHPGVDPNLLGVLASGNLLAVHLILRHHLVLHASAVRSGDGVVAFIGASGMGKSTLAAAYCGAGAELVTDDVMRVEVEPDGQVIVYPGAVESRLRLSARALTETGPASAVRHTADGRLAVRSPRRVSGPVPLAACVIPWVCPEVSRVSVRRLNPLTALRQLIRFPKIVGWREPESMSHTFQALGDLVDRVPVFEATLPLGLPFRPDTLASVMDGVLATGRGVTDLRQGERTPDAVGAAALQR